MKILIHCGLRERLVSFDSIVAQGAVTLSIVRSIFSLTYRTMKQIFIPLRSECPAPSAFFEKVSRYMPMLISKMNTSTGNKFKIFNSVIGDNVVYMVNNLGSFQRSSNMLFHHKSVLPNKVIMIGNVPRSIHFNIPSCKPSANEVMRLFAFKSLSFLSQFNSVFIKPSINNMVGKVKFLCDFPSSFTENCVLVIKPLFISIQEITHSYIIASAITIAI